jgi:multiple sugar transport system substrate-binding protein
MLRDGPWVAAQIKKAPDATRPYLKMGLMPFAVTPGGTSNSLHMPAKLDAEKKKLVWEFIRMTTEPQWQVKFTQLTSSPAPRKTVMAAPEIAANPELAMVNKAAADAVNLFPQNIAVREDFNEFAKIFVEYGMKLIGSDRPTADIMKEMQADMTKRVPPK